MRLRKTLTLLSLATGLAFALSAWAQQKPFSQEQNSNEVRAAMPPDPASAEKPINQVQVFALLAGQVPSHRVTMLVQERGVDFEPTNDYFLGVRLAGGGDKLISAILSAKVLVSSPIRFPFLEQSVVQRARLAQTLGTLTLQEFLRGGLPCFSIARFHSFLLHC
jgi:hypothetical protein